MQEGMKDAGSCKREGGLERTSTPEGTDIDGDDDVRRARTWPRSYPRQWGGLGVFEGPRGAWRWPKH